MGGALHPPEGHREKQRLYLFYDLQIITIIVISSHFSLLVLTATLLKVHDAACTLW